MNIYLPIYLNMHSSAIRQCTIQTPHTQADADDELNFFQGDVVEVLETAEGGWWRGRCRGCEGLFPVNYVDVNGGAAK